MSPATAEPTVFERIRSTCAAVADVGTHVRIVADAIPAFADTLDPQALARPADAPRGAHDAEAAAAYVMALDAVNFGSGWFPHLRKRPGLSGYRTIEASMREWIDATGPLTVERLLAVDEEAVAAIMGQRLDGGPAHELMALFTVAWHDLAFFVERWGDGSFVATVAAAGHRAANLVAMLDEMAFYHDVHEHPRAGEVLLYKRAQITAHDLARTFGGAGPGRFDDLDELTMFPDNLVPHVLRVDGVLEFDDDLVARIDAAEDIAIGSAAEIEIRAGAVHAVELLRAELAARGIPVYSGDLDTVLWRRGADPTYKAVPRHRTRCVFY